MVGAFGIGGMTSGLALVPRIKKMSIEKRVTSATVLYAIAMASVAFWHDVITVFVGVFVAGTALIVISSGLNFVAYSSVPSWVRTRVVSVHQMMYWGGMAFGSIVWGIVAEIWGVSTALLAASIGLIIGLGISTSYKLKPKTDVDMTPSMHWAMPHVQIDMVGHDKGAVLVEAEYLIDPACAHDFESVMNDMRSLRLRDGAINWELYHDVENPGRYVETFVSESWTEHLRQHERVTKEDIVIEDRARSFHIGKDPMKISHLIAEDTSRQNHNMRNKDAI